jgi:hypothetical protein
LLRSEIGLAEALEIDVPSLEWIKTYREKRRRVIDPQLVRIAALSTFAYSGMI